jgi:NTP pyrophosphatase (non-canonical NTP hydrolase)
VKRQYNQRLIFWHHGLSAVRTKPEAPLGDSTTSNANEICEPVTLRQAQDKVDQWIKDIGVRYFSELTNLAQLVEEVGEVARIISRTYGEQSFKDSEQDVSLKDEFADVLFVLICLANQTGVDLTEAFHENLRKKTKRDATRHHENEKLNP